VKAASIRRNMQVLCCYIRMPTWQFQGYMLTFTAYPRLYSKHCVSRYAAIEAACAGLKPARYQDRRSLWRAWSTMFRGRVGDIAISRASALEASVNGRKTSFISVARMSFVINSIGENMLQQRNAVLLLDFLYAITEVAFIRSLLRFLFILEGVCVCSHPLM